MIDVGSPFPEFSLSDQTGSTVSLDTLKGSKSVVYFYPKDDTSGCTVEACEFRDALPSISGVRVVGVSPDSAKSHAKFVRSRGRMGGEVDVRKKVHGRGTYNLRS